MDKLHVIFISSVKPEQTSAAAMNFHRHLVDNEEIALHILPSEHYEISNGAFSSRIIPKLKKTFLCRHAVFADHLYHKISKLYLALPSPIEIGVNKNAVVLTIAYKNGWWAAEKYARHYGLPLVVRFDDWWPDCAGVSSFFRSFIQKDWLELARKAQSSICISEGMRLALGLNADSPVIFPMPPTGQIPKGRSQNNKDIFKVCYLGNMNDYGPMLEKLARESFSENGIRIEFRGPKPSWPQGFQDEMIQKKLLHGFGTGEEFQNWFANFDAYLVAMFFEPSQRRRAETCFATKLMEYLSWGKPIIIWAPETAAIVKWAKNRNVAYCISTSDSIILLNEIKSLANNPVLQKELGKAARQAYETDCGPEAIQSHFLDVLKNTIVSK